jgi:hypothetical protein
MAISGAAFASAMGRHSKGTINSLLAVFNARLGVWLPNPSLLRSAPETRPAGPATGGFRQTRFWRWLRDTRRFTYLLKEIFGSYRLDDRFVYVTDGGHCENLGLVELLRRRCSFIFCFDASGDNPGFATTLSEAIALADEELGVEITFPAGALEAVAPGTVDIPDNGNADRLALLRRCAAHPVAVGDIYYRDRGEHGVLVFGKAVLTADSSPSVLAHAASRSGERFPNDSTGDQFFDQDQFAAYKELGRHVAEIAVQAAKRAESSAVPRAVLHAPDDRRVRTQ